MRKKTKHFNYFSFFILFYDFKVLTVLRLFLKNSVCVNAYCYKLAENVQLS